MFWWENYLRSRVSVHAVMDPVLYALHAWPLLHFCTYAPALKPSRINLSNLFACDVRREKENRGNTSGEKHFNMTKPAPGDPPLLFPVHEPSPLIPCSSFSLATSSLPLLVHFSPLMQIALCSPHIYDLLPPSVKYALKKRRRLNAASHIGLACINGQITSLLEGVKSKHSSMSIHEGALAFKGCVALSSIKLNGDWLMCNSVISAEADLMMLFLHLELL